MLLLLATACIINIDKGGDSDTGVDGCTPVTWYTDGDGDGFAADDAAGVKGDSCEPPTGAAQVLGDCDDTNGNVSPGATEVCDGSVDEDCDGLLDDLDDSIDPASQTAFYADGDGDTYGDANGASGACVQPAGTVLDSTDCDDADPSVNPAATELCGGGDENCDGATDEPVEWYADTDLDGYGDAANVASDCLAPAGYLADKTDCDDTRADISPAGTEVCNGADDDCDGLLDDADDSVDPASQTTYFGDADLDGYGDASVTTVSCSVPVGYAVEPTDCDESNAAINPGASEICDASDVDENCNGVADDADTSVDLSSATTWYADPDANGFGAPADTMVQCEPLAGYVSTLATAADDVCGSGTWADSTDSGTIDGTNLGFDSSAAFTVSFSADIDENVSSYVVVKGDNSTSEWSITTVPAGSTDVVTMCFNRQGLAALVCLEVGTAGFHNYTFVYDAGTITIYEDGVYAAAESGLIGSASTAALTVGNYPGATYPLMGDLDELAVWSGALGADQISAYADGTSLASDFVGNVGWWRFDEGSGVMTADLSGSATHMDLSGVDWSTTCR